VTLGYVKADKQELIAGIAEIEYKIIVEDPI
jgi:hypothetical protein